ncbi:MAG: DUF998 domain-containing protein [Mycobacteriaceae bacterium]
MRTSYTAIPSTAVKHCLMAGFMFAIGISYSSWVLEWALNPTLDPTTSFLSELAAPGQPYNNLFEYADTFTGSLTVCIATAGLLWFSGTALKIFSWIALNLFGAATIADSLVPLTCISSCATENSGFLPQLHQTHALTSTAAVLSIFAAIGGFTILAARNHLFPQLHYSRITILTILIASTLWLSIADNLERPLAVNLYLGVIQRIEVSAISLWLTLFGVSAYLEYRMETKETSR